MLLTGCMRALTLVLLYASSASHMSKSVVSVELLQDGSCSSTSLTSTLATTLRAQLPLVVSSGALALRVVGRRVLALPSAANAGEQLLGVADPATSATRTLAALVTSAGGVEAVPRQRPVRPHETTPQQARRHATRLLPD